MRISGILSGRFAVLLLVLAAFGMPASASGQAGAGASEAAPTELFTDFLHYIRLGRFNLADKYADALLKHPDLDAVALLREADADRASIETLQLIVRHPGVGQKAADILKLLQEGEDKTRKSPERIRMNIDLLGGTPQQKLIGMENLAKSGEYAIPALVAVLHDDERPAMHLPVRDALAAIGKPAVTPLCIAASTHNNFARDTIIDVLGRLGYDHSVPYLRGITVDGNLPQESRAAAVAAIDRIAEIRGRATEGAADDLFFKLADRYFNEDDAVRADPRLSDANVWYWDIPTESLVPTVVKTKIFGPVMAMRCCQSALALRHDNADAISLWLASNIRRESRLGMNVESGDPNRSGEEDATRPTVFPSALFFTQAAGPRYAHMVLNRAVGDGDSAVALGAIEALRITAGEASLIGDSGSRLPLVEALHFPDLVVRTRAALALGAALPRSPFSESQYVIPLLSKALNLSGREAILVIDSDEDNLNRISDSLRTGDRIVIGDTNFLVALGRARAELQRVTGIFVSTDVSAPDLATCLKQLRSEVNFSKTPVIVMAKPSQSGFADNAAAADNYVEASSSSNSGGDLLAALDRVRVRTGQVALDGDLAGQIALQAAQTLYAIALDGRTVYDHSQAESALVAAMDSGSSKLQVAAGSVLAMMGTTNAQSALIRVGLNDGQSDDLRIAMLDAATRSARQFGNLIPEKLLNSLVDSAGGETNLSIRTAASQVLGALNLKSNNASAIIRGYHQ